MRCMKFLCIHVGDAYSKSMRACEEISKQIQEKFTEKMKENNVWLATANDLWTSLELKSSYTWCIGADFYKSLWWRTPCPSPLLPSLPPFPLLLSLPFSHLSFPSLSLPFRTPPLPSPFCQSLNPARGLGALWAHPAGPGEARLPHDFLVHFEVKSVPFLSLAQWHICIFTVQFECIKCTQNASL